jgi:hypothetical protein
LVAPFDIWFLAFTISGYVCWMIHFFPMVVAIVKGDSQH